MCRTGAQYAAYGVGAKDSGRCGDWRQPRLMLILARSCARALCHSSAVSSHISQGNLSETKSRSSVPTTRMPVFTEMRLEARFTTPFGTRRRVKPRISNQKSLTAITASVIRPWLSAIADPARNPRLSNSFLCRAITPMWQFWRFFQSQGPVAHSSPRSVAGSALSR